MTKQDSFFDASYFDGRLYETGAYRSYEFEKLKLAYLSLLIKTHLNPSNVLDIGCASGILIELLESLDISASGVDINKHAIESAADNVRTKLHYADLNCDSLPFNDKSFDAVTFLGTIEYLKSDSLALGETWRVLKDGGSLILKTETKRPAKDRLRINIHEAEYWITRIESKGFVRDKSTSSLLQRDYERTMASLFFQAGRSKLTALELVLSSFPENWPVEEVLIKLIAQILVRKSVKWLFFSKATKKR